MTDNRTLYEYLLQGTRDPEEVKIIFFDNKIKSTAILRDIDAIAAYLVSKGVKAGDSVGISMPNTPHAVIATYAVSKLGGIVNAIHPLISTNGLIKSLKICKAKYLFVLDRFYVNHEKALRDEGIEVIYCHVSDYLKNIKGFLFGFTEQKHFSVGTDYKTVLKSKGETMPVVGTGELPAVYLHSGGTSGEPKTVSLSANAVNTLADNIVKSGCGEYKYSSADSMLMVLPLFHGFGFAISMHTVIARGRLILMPTFNAKEAIQLIKKYKITMLSGVPAMYQKMMDLPQFDGAYLSSLKLIFCGGDKLTDFFQDEFNGILKKNGSTAELQEGYGLTEAVSVVSVNKKGLSKKGSVGQAIDGTEIRIVDKNLRTVAAGEEGEILVSNPSVMLEYLDDEEGTARCKIKLDGKNFIHTGDIGSMDADGYLYFKDREKRVIKISGINIFPSEIERIVSNLKEIKYACVVPTAVNGKAATKLYVVLNEGFQYSQLIEDHIKVRIAEETIKYAVPRIIVPVKTLKLTETGKVDIKFYLAKEKSEAETNG